MSEIEEKKAIDEAVAKFRELMGSQLDRAKRIKATRILRYQSLDKIVIGICGGDGIGPIITKKVRVTNS
ncbi:MAG: hypothetical protein ACLR6O_02850 [Eubacterium sp.]